MQRIRQAVGSHFIIIYRLSMLDLIAQGSNWEEIVALAKAIESAGATIINTGIGWHEARIPTIASMVPAGAFAAISKRLKPEVTVPVITSNRINTPELANALIEEGAADMISMARPFLADAQFAAKACRGETKAINVCIACNQACLDQVFKNKRASCMVNPRAGNETELVYEPVQQPKKIAVVGAGPAGMAFAAVAAERGHVITLFEKNQEMGGQFTLAKQVPGKEEYHHTIAYYTYQLEKFQVQVRLNTSPTVEALLPFDEVVLTTGVSPKIPPLEGIQHEKVMSYIEVLEQTKVPGKRVAVMGAGGIGFDIAEWLIHQPHDQESKDLFYREWGIDLNTPHRGGLIPPEPTPCAREVYLLQRKKEKLGKRLGKTTGWIHRLQLKHKHVKMLSGVTYVRIDDQGLHIVAGGEPKILEVDSIVLCTGQTELRTLYDPLKAKGRKVHLIGGAFKALELDAKHAINQACRLAALL